MRAIVLASMVFAGCSGSSASSVTDAASDGALQCDALDPSGGGGPSCPATSDGLLAYCGSVVSDLEHDLCGRFDDYTLHYGTDTWKGCYYDPSSRALVGRDSWDFGTWKCWGGVPIGTSCTTIDFDLCSHDAGHD